MATAIFFDVDGTLLHFTGDYDRLLADVFEAVLGTVRREWIETVDETFQRHQRRGSPDAYRAAMLAVDEVQSDDVDPLLERLLRREVETTRTPPETASTLERLADRHPLGVLTNGLGEWQRSKLAAFGLEDYFDAVVGCDDAGTLKPAVEPFECAERQIPAERYALVGDSGSDRTGAERAGWRFLEYSGERFTAIEERIERG